MPPTSLSPLALTRLTRDLRRVVCSAPWLDVCLAAIESGRIRPNQRIAASLDKARLYPPGGCPRPHTHRTLMRHCHHCGHKWYPPHYLHHKNGPRFCEDCIAAAAVPYTDERTHTSTTASPSAAAIHELGLRRQRLIELRLPADDMASLRREIAAFQRIARPRIRPAVPT